MVVGTRTRERGRARLKKYVVTEHVQKTVPVRREEVRVEFEPTRDDSDAGTEQDPPREPLLGGVEGAKVPTASVCGGAPVGARAWRHGAVGRSSSGSADSRSRCIILYVFRSMPPGTRPEGFFVLGRMSAVLIPIVTGFGDGRFLPGFHVTPGTLFTGGVVALLLTVASGVFPAWQAARLPVVQALRRVE